MFEDVPAIFGLTGHAHVGPQNQLKAKLKLGTHAQSHFGHPRRAFLYALP